MDSLGEDSTFFKGSLFFNGKVETTASLVAEGRLLTSDNIFSKIKMHLNCFWGLTQ